MPGADQPNTTSPNETATSPNETATNQNNNANQNEANNNQDNSDSNFSGSEGLASGAGGFASPGGYLDDAIPQTMFKLRYDSESGINRFDRADYMFGTWREGSFHTHALVGGGAVRGTFSDPKATGSQIISNDVSDQILSAAMEYAFSQRLSVFVDVPFQFVHFGPDIEDAVEPQGMTKQANEPHSIPGNRGPQRKAEPHRRGRHPSRFQIRLHRRTRLSLPDLPVPDLRPDG